MRIVLLLLSLVATATEYNLLPVDAFMPISMHGRVSAARGWMMRDRARAAACSGSNPEYVSGEECFELGIEDGAMTIRFLEPLHPVYAKKFHSVRFEATTVPPLPPAPQYRFTGKTKFNCGTLVVGERLKVQPSDDWQPFEYVGASVAECFAVIPEEGSVFSFKDFCLTALYPEPLRDTILLPDGGELRKIVLQPDGSGLLRRLLLLWRGWLWKLTGVALPIEEVAEVSEAVPGALAVRLGEAPPGGWNLKVNHDGILLTVGNPLEIAPALFDYLNRHCGYRNYNYDCVVEVSQNPDRVLPECDFTAAPRFYTLACGLRNGFLSGGVDRDSNIALNQVDYYHLPEPESMHILNLLMPKEMYFQEHPEYYMLNKKGERQADIYPYWLQPCFSNAAAVDLVVRNLLQYAKLQPYRRQLLFYTGDNPWYCVCPQCLQTNGENGGSATTMLHVMGKVADAFAAAGIPQRVFYPGYEGTMRPLKEPPNPKLHAELSLGHDVLPCTLHVECELNRPGYELVQEWSRAFGGRERMEIQTYRDARPRHFLRQMEFVNQYACEGLLIYGWHGYDPAVQYVAARWNLGVPAQEAIDDYNRGVYGAGAEIFNEIEEIIDDFSRNYQHTQEEKDNLAAGRVQHVAIRCGTLKTRSVLDRRTFNRLYEAFDQALAAVGDTDASARNQLLRQKASYLLEDLNLNRRFTAKSAAETADFAYRLAMLCQIAREVPSLQDNVWIYCSGRTFVQAVSGLTVPDTGKKWCFEPFIEEFLAAPASMIPPPDPEKTASGWRFPPALLSDGVGVQLYDYQCPPRLANFIRRPSLGNSCITATLSLDQPIRTPMKLLLTGLDDDKPGASSIRVKVNDKVCFEGEVPFGEEEWTSLEVALPDGLPAGRNTIDIENITPDMPSRNPRPGNATSDLQWGWVAIAELELLAP